MAKKSKGKGNGTKTKKKTKAEITVTVKDEVELPVKNNEIIEDHDSGDNENLTETDNKKQKEPVSLLLEKQLDFLKQLRNYDQELSSLEKEYEKSRKDVLSNKKKVERELFNLTKRLPKLQQSELATASKQKRKRKGPNNGGFNKSVPVPKILVKYLNLDEGTELSRPKVMSLLSTKFKEKGLKDGKKIILDKKAAKVFGKKSGYVIEFKDQQPFLKEIYQKEKNHIDI